jgi:hypothetical protein
MALSSLLSMAGGRRYTRREKSILRQAQEREYRSAAVKFSDAVVTTWPFAFCGVTIAGPKISVKELTKATAKLKLTGLPTFPA